MNYLLYLASAAFIVLGGLFAVIAVGGIHEATAAILVIGGFALAGIGNGIGCLKEAHTELRNIYQVARRLEDKEAEDKAAS